MHRIIFESRQQLVALWDSLLNQALPTWTFHFSSASIYFAGGGGYGKSTDNNGNSREELENGERASRS